MKLNEKIKEYRKIFGLSQEQLAEKLGVSRQAITKWENDGGLPDISNLKPLASLFGVSIDYLLDDEKNVYDPIMKESLLIEEKNTFSNRYDFAVSILKERYPKPCIIYGLSQSKNMTKLEWFMSLIIGPSKVGLIQYLNEFAIWFLVKTDAQKLLIKVTDKYMETRELSNLIDENKFVVEKDKFVKMKEV